MFQAQHLFPTMAWTCKYTLPLADTEVNGIIPIISAFLRELFTYQIPSQLPRKQLALLYLEQADGRVV